MEIVSINGSNKKPKGFAAGFSKLGDLYIEKDFQDITGNEHCFYHFGGISIVKNLYSDENFKGINFIQQSNRPFLVGEYTPFRKIPNYFKLGWLSYNHKNGIFNNSNVNGIRWKNFKQQNNLQIKDWNHPGENILILGQVEYDSALNNLYASGYLSIYDWIFDTIEKIRKITDRPIVIRPHPSDFKLPNILAKCMNYEKVTLSTNFNAGEYKNTRSGGDGFYQDLMNSYCVVSYSSNGVVEAICNGIPVFVADSGSPGYPLSQKSLDNLESIDFNKDIDQWGTQIVYSIWNFKEIYSGEAWAHLKPVFF